jgi:5-methyltetrahydrofolate--homocysteine methyltransferase
MQFDTWLKDKGKIILFDGAMGTQVIQRGLEPGKLPDLLNIDQPHIIQDILSDYFKSGSDMVQTCTFSSNYINLASQHLDHKLIDLNKQALLNSSIVKAKNKLIVGDIGPSGEYRPPVGSADENKWKKGFEAQVRILDSGVDIWHIETMSDIIEMKSAIQAIKEISTKPIMASMTYKKTKRKGFYTIMGDSVEKCVSILEEEDVAVIGTNCTLGSDQMIELAEQLVSITKKPISVKPNAGQPRLEGGRVVYEQPPDDFVRDIKKMIDLGVKIVGGCCGTTPEHILKLRTLIDSNKVV